MAMLAHSQISKGSILIGGNIDPGYAQIGDQEKYVHGINPSIGVALKENKIWGVQYYYDQFKREKYGIDKNMKSTKHGAGIFYRQYVPIGRKFYFLGQATAFHTRQMFNYISSSNAVIETKYWSTGLSLNTGVSFAIAKKVHLEAGFTNLLLSYNRSKTSETTVGNTIHSGNRSFTFNPWPALNVGFRFIIDTKKKTVVRKTYY